MRWMTALVLPILSSCMHTTDSQIKVVGGTAVDDDANVGAVGATAAVLGADGAQFCSGTLIEARRVLTAAHCLISPAPNAAFVTFNITASTGAKVAVQSAHASPHYNALTHDDDIGYLDLAADAAPTPIPVASGTERDQLLTPGTSVLLVGYGITALNGIDNGIKRQALSAVGQVTSKQFNTAATHTDTCQGDSGGPAFAKTDLGWRVLGVTSTRLRLHGRRSSASNTGPGTYSFTLTGSLPAPADGENYARAKFYDSPAQAVARILSNDADPAKDIMSLIGCQTNRPGL